MWKSYPNLKSSLNFKNLKHHNAKHKPRENDNSIRKTQRQNDCACSAFSHGCLWWASFVEGTGNRSVRFSYVLGISVDGNGFYLSQRQWNVDGDDFWETLNGKWHHWNKKLSTYCVKAVLFYLLPKRVFLRLEICKACRFKFFRHRRLLGTTISIDKLKWHLIMYFCHVSPPQSDNEANVFTSTFA